MEDEGRSAVEPRLFASVPRARGEESRVWLSEQGLLDPHARPVGDGPLLHFPLSERSVPGAATALEAAEGCGARDDGTVDAGALNPEAQSFATHFGARFSVREARVRTRDRQSYLDVARVPAEAKPHLPQGFDQIGDVAVVTLDDLSRPYEAEVARAILAAYRGIRVVAADDGVTGELRLRALRKLAGDGPLRTVHKEFGLSIEADLEKAFFTPRLAGERRRVALMVAPYERVLDAFAGVGPISVQIAKLQPSVHVDAVDLNPEAVALLRENARRNKLPNIEAHEAEFGAFAATRKPLSYSRIVMNLPHRAKEFLPAALPLVARGGSIHLYAILPIDRVLPEQGALRAMGEKAGRPITILRARPIKSYSPTDLFVVFDLRVD